MDCGSGGEQLSPISTIDLDTYLTLLPTVKNQAKLTNRNKATDFLKNGKNTLHRYITGAVLLFINFEDTHTQWFECYKKFRPQYLQQMSTRRISSAHFFEFWILNFLQAFIIKKTTYFWAAYWHLFMQKNIQQHIIGKSWLIALNGLHTYINNFYHWRNVVFIACQWTGHVHTMPHRPMQGMPTRVQWFVIFKGYAPYSMHFWIGSGILRPKY